MKASLRVDGEPQPKRPCRILHLVLQQILDLVLIQRERKIARTVCQPSQMTLLEQDPTVRPVGKCLQKVKFRLGRRHEFQLQPAFVIFRRGAGVIDNTRTRPRLAGSVVPENEGSYGNIEPEVAIGLETADRPCVDTTRGRLERISDGHCAQLRRAGYRTAGKEVLDDPCKAGSLRQLALDGRGHLMDRLVPLDRAEFGHPHASRVRNSGQVVAHQIDNHRVLGTLLRVSCQVSCDAPILRDVDTSPRGALHRPGTQHLPLSLKEQLRRQRNNRALV